MTLANFNLKPKNYSTKFVSNPIRLPRGDAKLIDNEIEKIKSYRLLISTLSEGTRESFLVRVISSGHFTAKYFQNVTNVNIRSLALIFIYSFDEKYN